MDKKYNLAREIATCGKRDFELSFEEFNRRDLVPRETRDLTAGIGTATNAFFLIGNRVPDVLEALRPESLLGALPITVLSGLTSAITLPRVNVGVLGATQTEVSTVSELDPTFLAPGTLQPLRMSSTNSFSKQLLAQAGGQGISDLVKKDLAKGIAQKLDNQLLKGNGITLGQATGILNQSANFTNTFAFGGAAAWPAFLGAQNLLETTFVRPDHWLIGPATALKIRQVLEIGTGTNTANCILQGGMIGDYPCVVTPHLSTAENAILGQWDLVYVLIWGDGLDVTVDPYTLAGTGEIKVTANLNYNICVRHLAALAVSTDAGNQ